MAYIEFKNINKYFGDNQVLKNTNLNIEKGDFVTLLGPSGCGKSTMLRCLSGLESINEGTIILDGEDITFKNPKDRNIGMVFQHYSLFPNLNVFDNIAFGLKIKKLSEAVIKEKVEAAIKMVELEGKEKAYPANLSGGQQQRVALARAIVMEPKVLLLDEPLSAIDARLRKALQKRIKEIHKTLGLTTVFVTHDQDEAMIMSDVIHLFNEGKIEQSGDPISLYTSPKTAFAASFIGNYDIFDAKEFSRVLSDEYIGSNKVAIRPETISISTTKPTHTEDDFYYFEGKIIDSISHGNVIRYSIDVEGIKMHADLLFRSFAIYDIDTKVYLSIEKRNCLKI